MLPLAWRSTMTPNLLAQVCVYVAPKKNLAGGLCKTLDVLLTVGEDGKFNGVVPSEGKPVPSVPHPGPYPYVH